MLESCTAADYLRSNLAAGLSMLDTQSYEQSYDSDIYRYCDVVGQKPKYYVWQMTANQSPMQPCTSP
jgi:hypothetical protein